MAEVDVKVAVLGARIDAHEKHCTDISERTASDINAIRSTMERESGDRKSAIDRIHQRMDGVASAAARTESEVAALSSAVKALPASIAAEIANAKQSGQLWIYGRVIGGGGIVVAALWQLFMKS